MKFVFNPFTAKLDYVLTDSDIDHGSIGGLTDIADHPGYLILTGARAGATSEIQVFNHGIRVLDKIEFTQVDGNEYIDSLNDGYLDIGATTAIRLLQDTNITGNLYFSSNYSAQFRDAQLYVNSDADGHLDLHADTIIDLNADISLEGTALIKEQATANADVASYGQLWVKSTTPNELWFTDDAGTDVRLGLGSPGGADTQVQFNDGGSFGGDADFVWNKATNALTIGGISPELRLFAATGDTPRLSSSGVGVKDIRIIGQSSFTNLAKITADPSLGIVFSFGADTPKNVWGENDAEASLGTLTKRFNDLYLAGDLKGGTTDCVLYMDVLATDTDGILTARAWQDETVTEGSLDGQPDVPRNVTVTLIGIGTPEGTITINGIDADGAVISEVFTVSALGLAGGDKAFARITSVVTDQIDIGSFQYTVGWSDKLGLPNYPFNATTDLFKIKLNNNNIRLALFTINATYGTALFATPITGGDDFTYWYRPYKV